MSPSHLRGRVLRFPTDQPWAPPVWRVVRVGRVQASPSGVRRLERVVVRLVRRGWQLLRALDEASNVNMESVDDGPILGLLAVDGSWIDLLCHLARHEVGAADLEPFVADVRRLAREQLAHRQSIYDELSPEERGPVAASERSQRVTELEVRHAVVDLLMAIDGENDDEGEDEDDFGGQNGPARGARTTLADLNVMRRAEWEARALPSTSGLRPCLRALPVEWLDGISATLSLPLSGRRRDREASIAAHLLEEGTVDALVASLPERVRSTLDALLSASGRAPASTLTRRFGSDANDSWFWMDQPPGSPLGQLRSCGLVFVGRSRVEDGLGRVAVIPPELRPLLITP